MLSLLKSLPKTIESLGKNGDSPKHYRVRALRALKCALVETEVYYLDFVESKRRDKNIEEQLALYWKAASIPFKLADKDFYKYYTIHHTSWIHANQWEADINSGNIADFNKAKGMISSRLANAAKK